MVSFRSFDGLGIFMMKLLPRDEFVGGAIIWTNAMPFELQRSCGIVSFGKQPGPEPPLRAQFMDLRSDCPCGGGCTNVKPSWPARYEGTIGHGGPGCGRIVGSALAAANTAQLSERFPCRISAVGTVATVVPVVRMRLHSWDQKKNSFFSLLRGKTGPPKLYPKLLNFSTLTVEEKKLRASKSSLRTNS